MNIEWFEKDLCKFLPDFHNPGNEKIGEKFDAKAIIKSFLDHGIKTFTLFSKDNYGYSYYPTNIGTRHPGLDFDFFGEMVEEAHKNGMRVVVYHALNYEYVAGLKNPDWIVEAKDGSKYVHVPNSEVREYQYVQSGDAEPLKGQDQFMHEYMFMDIKTMKNLGFHFICVNSPYIQELFWPQLKEILTNYKIDGYFLDMLFYPDDACYCPYCRKEMAIRGIDIEDKAAVHKFKEESMYRVARETTKFIHSIDPECAVGYDNTTFLGCYREKEANDYWVVESQPWNFGYIHGPMYAKYLRNTERPFEFMGTRFHHMWGDFGGYKHANELKLDAATTIANGGVFEIGHQMPNTNYFEPDLLDLVKDVSDFVNERADYCINAKPFKSIAVFAHEELPYAAINRTEFFTKRRLENTKGAVKMLMEAHEHFDLIDELMDLSQYKVLVLPEHRELPCGFEDKIREFVKNGGILISSYLTAFEDGKFKLADVTGVEYIGTSPYSTSYAHIDDEYRKDIPQDFAVYDNIIDSRYAEGAKGIGHFINPLFEKSASRFHSHAQAPYGVETDYPVAVINEYGKGKSVWFAFNIFEMFAKEDYYVHRRFFEAVLHDVYADDIIRNVKAPRSMEFNLMEQPEKNRTIAHMISCLFKRPSMDLMPRIEDAYPIGGIHFELALDKPVRNVSIEPEGKVAWKIEDGLLKLDVDGVAIHSMVVIEH